MADDMKPKPQGKTNKAAILLLVIFAIVIVATVLGLIWRNASPFDTPATDGFPQIDGKTHANELKHESGSSPEQEENVMAVSVTMKDGAPMAAFRLPSSGTWGLPRFFFERDAQTNGWNLVFIPPAGKGDYDQQIRALASPWRQVLPDNSESTAGKADAAFGSRHQVSIPSGKVQIRSGIPLKENDYAQRRAEKLKSSAAALSDLAKDEAAKKDFLKALQKEIPGAVLAFRDVSGDSATNVALLNRLADAGHLYLCSKRDRASTENALLDKFYFDASPLRWVGSLSFSRTRCRSPFVEVRASNATAEYDFESAYRDTSDDPRKEQSLISEFQKNTAEQFASKAPKTTWPGDPWLNSDDPVSLNSVSFIGVLQSLDVLHSKGAENAPNPILIALATGITSDRVSQLRGRLDRIANVSDVGYHNTYLYCEYVVALVHLQKLVHKIPGNLRDQYDREALTNLILDASGRIADNVTPDGRFKRHLSGPQQDWDRSVGQVALYTLQYVQLHFSGEKPNDKTRKVNDALKKLAAGHGRFRAGVPYDDGNSPHTPLEPAHFQASIAKLQLELAGSSGLIGKEEFQDDLRRIESIFSSTFTLHPDPVYQAYQLMYWARVYELLESLRQEPKLRAYFTGHDRAIDKLRASLASRLAVYRLQDFTGPHWEPNPRLSLKPTDPPPEVRIVMLVIALESLRTAYELRPQDAGK